MPELIIKYKSKKILEALKDLAKYFNFSIISPSGSRNSGRKIINGVTIIPGNSSIDVSELSEIFTGKGLNAKQLRNQAWQRSM